LEGAVDLPEGLVALAQQEPGLAAAGPVRCELRQTSACSGVAPAGHDLADLRELGLPAFP
jgi:hypothetical protein